MCVFHSANADDEIPNVDDIEENDENVFSVPNDKAGSPHTLSDCLANFLRRHLTRRGGARLENNRVCKRDGHRTIAEYDLLCCESCSTIRVC